MIKDKVLDPNAFNDVYNSVKNSAFQIRDHKVHEGDGNECLTHIVYHYHKPQSDTFQVLNSYFHLPLNVVSWWSIRLCLTFKEDINRVFGYHTDYPGPDYNFKHMKTAIYYLSDTNGPTSFENGDTVECVKNRLLIFPSHKFHSAVTHTEGDAMRLIINFNYF